MTGVQTCALPIYAYRSFSDIEARYTMPAIPKEEKEVNEEEPQSDAIHIDLDAATNKGVVEMHMHEIMQQTISSKSSVPNALKYQLERFNTVGK